MELVIVERTFPEAIEFDDLQAMEDRSSWCFELHNVRFVHSYFSNDKRRMICVYEAPDAESVRLAQQKASLPFERVWTAKLYGGRDGHE